VQYGTVATFAKAGPPGATEEGANKEDPKPEPEAKRAPDKPAPPAAAAPTPEQECRNWLQMAHNFLLNGQKETAKAYLQKVLDKYPNTPWAEQAREQMKQTQ